MAEHSLQSRLASCDAFVSLAGEKRLASLLRRLKWRVSHGMYYRDPQTRKLREIDVCATRALIVREDPRIRMAIIRMLIEAKSAKGFHILFSPDQPPEEEEEEDRLDRMWLGENQRARKWMTLRLREAKSERHSGEFGRLWEDMAYEDGCSIIEDLIVPPPRATYHASAFRETNIGATKTLDSSVLWRARLGVASAVGGMKRREVACWFDNLMVTRDAAECGQRDVFTEVIEDIVIQMRFVTLYHPIVVIDAPLWWIGQGKPKQIDWCRLRQHAIGTSWWCDVVRSESFTKFANMVTKHYIAELKARSRGKSLLTRA